MEQLSTAKYLKLIKEYDGFTELSNIIGTVFKRDNFPYINHFRTSTGLKVWFSPSYEEKYKKYFVLSSEEEWDIAVKLNKQKNQETELIVGEWYTSPSWHNNSFFKFLRQEGAKIFHSERIEKGEYSKKEDWWYYRKNIRLATKEEIRQALISIAKEKYKVGDVVHPAHLSKNNHSFEILEGELENAEYLDEENETCLQVSSGNPEKNRHSFSETILHGGEWARIKEPEKSKFKPGDYCFKNGWIFIKTNENPYMRDNTAISLSSKSYYKGDAHISDINRDPKRLATQEEKDWLDACIKAGKFVEKPTKEHFAVAITESNIDTLTKFLKKNADSYSGYHEGWRLAVGNKLMYPQSQNDCHSYGDGLPEGINLLSFKDFRTKFEDLFPTDDLEIEDVPFATHYALTPKECPPPIVQVSHVNPVGLDFDIDFIDLYRKYNITKIKNNLNKH